MGQARIILWDEMHVSMADIQTEPSLLAAATTRSNTRGCRHPSRGLRGRTPGGQFDFPYPVEKQ